MPVANSGGHGGLGGRPGGGGPGGGGSDSAHSGPAGTGGGGRSGGGNGGGGKSGGFATGTTVGGMGTNPQGYANQKATPEKQAVSHGPFGIFGHGIEDTGNTVPATSRNSLSPENANNVSKAFRGYAGTDDGFAEHLGKMVAAAFGIHALNPTAMSQPPGVDPNAPARTGKPNMAVDPVDAILGAAGVVNPLASFVHMAYSGLKSLTGYQGPQIGLGNPGDTPAAGGAIGTDNGTNRATGNQVGHDQGLNRPSGVAAPPAAAAPAPSAAPAADSNALIDDGTNVATGRNRNYQKLLGATGSVL